MVRKTWWLGMLLVVLSSAGCCRWADRWCGRNSAPVGYGAAQCVPCCPVQCAPSSPAPQFQRGPYGCP